MPRKGLTKERYERLNKLNVLLAQGGYSMPELARRFGVADPVIYADRTYIMENWWKDREEHDTTVMRLHRVKELEQLKRLALESYYRSREDKSETTTSYEKKTCEECDGTGRLPKCKCIACDGLGYAMEEKVITKVSGRAGSAEFLHEARACVQEIAKLEALYKIPEQRNVHIFSGAVAHTHVQLEKKYAGVDHELILRAKVAMALLEEAAERNKLVLENSGRNTREVVDDNEEEES